MKRPLQLNRQRQPRQRHPNLFFFHQFQSPPSRVLSNTPASPRTPYSIRKRALFVFDVVPRMILSGAAAFRPLSVDRLTLPSFNSTITALIRYSFPASRSIVHVDVL